MICPSCNASNDNQAETCFTCGKSLSSINQGSVIADRYEILRQIGRGGMGMIYKAHDRVLDETVALKTLRPHIATDADMVRRFRAEIKMARKIRHRNVCAIHDYGEDRERGLLYISMEYIDGIDLKQVIREEGAFPPEDGYSVSIQVAKGLEAIHEAGVIHRDLKSHNLMRDSKGVIKLLDFGIAKQQDVDTGMTGTGQIVGTPEYMSPEQVRGGRIDFRSDLYALGVVIFEIFTGHVPFRGDTPVITIFKHLQEPPPLEGPQAAGIPEALIPLLAKILAKDPGQRYANAGDVIDALRQARSSSLPEITPTPLLMRTAIDVPSPLEPPKGATPPPRAVTPPPPLTPPPPAPVPPPPAPPVVEEDDSEVVETAYVDAAARPMEVVEEVLPEPLTEATPVVDDPAAEHEEPFVETIHEAPPAPPPVTLPPPRPEPPPAARAAMPAPPPAAKRTAIRDAPAATPATVPRPAPVEQPDGEAPTVIPGTRTAAAPARPPTLARPRAEPAPQPAASAVPGLAARDATEVRPAAPPSGGSKAPLIAAAAVVVVGVVAGAALLMRGKGESTPPATTLASDPGTASAPPVTAPGIAPVVEEEVKIRADATPTPGLPSPGQPGATPAPLGSAPPATLPVIRPSEPPRIADAGVPPVTLPPVTRPPVATPPPATPAPTPPPATRSFAPGKVSIGSGKSAGKGPAGFDTGGFGVAAAAEFSGRCELDMSPATLKAGDGYVVKVFVANDGKKETKFESLSSFVIADGRPSPSTPVPLKAKEVAPGQRVLVGEVPGTWTDPKTWRLEVTLTTNKKDTCKNSLTANAR